MSHAQTLTYIFFQAATVTALLTAQTLNAMKSRVFGKDLG